ncbi:MAG: hypothetical protein NTX36_03420 [Proteobacteria bacterium]|nr:hypothetical protein [Pseudomonadota bacterium]
MKKVTYYSTNNPGERVNFETALLKGMASDYGLYMVARNEAPVLDSETIKNMRTMSYAEIAFEVLFPYLWFEIPAEQLRLLLNDTYREDKIPTLVQHVIGGPHIMWLTQGPTYSFKDYAARFFGRALNYFLGKTLLLQRAGIPAALWPMPSTVWIALIILYFSQKVP